MVDNLIVDNSNVAIFRYYLRYLRKKQLITMKQFPLPYLIFFFILASCSNNEEPEYSVFMQPLSIQSEDANANNQTFEYDDYGRIVSWKCATNSPNHPSFYTARYSYPDANTIRVTAEEVWLNQQRLVEESIQLHNGRATKSEGTFIYSVDGNRELQKTYRLAFDYLPTNHLNIVEHLEVVGIGDDIKDNAWDNAWKWVNYLIWENGNLKEYQDYQGSSKHYQSTKYEYLEDKASYPVIIPMVINNAHHMPLCMQGVFGPFSSNLIHSASTFDFNSNLTLTRQYSYEFFQERISKYTETYNNSVLSNPILYSVTWTE